jgi:hypothetical protein
MPASLISQPNGCLEHRFDLALGGEAVERITKLDVNTAIP